MGNNSSYVNSTYFLFIASLTSLSSDLILLLICQSIDYYNPFDKACTHPRKRFFLLKDFIFLMFMLAYSIITLLLATSSSYNDWDLENISLIIISVHWLLIRVILSFYYILGNTIIYRNRNIVLIRLLSLLPNCIEILAIGVVYFTCFTHHFHYEDTKVTTYSSKSLVFPISLLSNLIWSSWWFLEKIYNDQGGYTQYMVAGYYINNENGYEIGQRRIDRNNVMFYWLTPVLTIGYQRQLELNDLTNLPKPIRSRYTLKSFIKALSRYKHTKLSKLNKLLNQTKSHSNNNFIINNTLNPNNLDIHNHCVDWFKLKGIAETTGALYEFIHILYNIFGSKFLTVGFIKFCLCLVNFSGPILLGQMVDYIQEFAGTTTNISFGIALVLLLGSSFVATAMLNSCYNVRCTVMQTKINGMLSRIIFSKAMLLPSYVWNEDLEISDNQLITLVQVDVSRVANICQSIHDLWTLPFEIIVAFILLYFQVKEAFFAGVAIIVLVIPLNTYIARRIGINTQGMMKYKDIRVQIISEAITNIKSIKMLSWENIVMLLSKPNRDKECMYLSRRKYLDAVCVFLWASMPVLVPFATFSTTVLLGIPLTAAKVFTTIALLNMLIFPMNAFPWVINGFVEAYVSSCRLMNILSSSNGQSLGLDCLSISENIEDSTYKYENESVIDSNMSLLLEINEAVWLRKGLKDNLNKDLIIDEIKGNPKNVRRSLINTSDGFIIGPISLKVSSSTIIGIIGPVASGKSSFLLGLMHEVCQVSGICNYTSRVCVSYCPQIPIMHSGCSIRDNILMGGSYEKDRYHRIIQGCGLDYDFLSNTFPNKDKSELVQGGNNLSGGQKLRIGIARALYSTSQVVLLDDPFSALDRTTSQKLMDFLLKEVKEINPSRAIILTSHHVHLLKPCDLIIYLNDGKEICRGDYNIMIQPQSRISVDLSIIDTIDDRENNSNIIPNTSIPIIEKTVVEDDEYDYEFMKEGKIDSNVYWHYISSAGILITFTTILFTCLMQVSANAMAFWLSYWVSNQNSFTDKQFIYISSIIVGINIVFSLIRSFLFAYGTLKSSKRLYEQLIQSVLGASITFLESVNSGKLINRFGKDIFNIDDTLPFMLNIVLAQIFLLIGSFVVIIYSDPLILIILFCICIIYYKLQKFYRSSSRELKRLDSIYKSPVYTIINECIMNGITIRISKQIQYYEKKFEIALDNSLRVTRIVNLSTQWLNIRLQLLGAIVATSLALSSVLCSTFQILPISASLLGLSLSYSLTLVGNLNGLIGSFTETEKEMISVERVREYINLPNEYHYNEEQQSHIDMINSIDTSIDSEDILDLTNKQKKLYQPLLTISKKKQNLPFYGEIIQNYSNFLIKGEIIIRNLSLQYQENLSPALIIHNLSIQAGDRIAVIGRTGSGKSSLLKVLLCLHQYKGDVFIDGNNIKYIPKYILRSAISIIPQDPVLFTSSIRFNLDPLNQYTDIEILNVIDICGLRSTLENSNNKSIEKEDENENESENENEHENENGNVVKNVIVNEENINDNNNKSLTYFSISKTCSFYNPKENTKKNEMLLNYEIKDGGRNLSQGQKQLICLARALLKKSKLILIDEATAAVDPITESLVYKVLSENAIEFGATVLCICHKLEGVTQLCNKILELKDGKIIRFEDMK